MASTNELERRIRELEDLLAVKRVDWGHIYDLTREMDLKTGLQDDPDFEEEFIAREGTRDEFIARKETEWRAKNPQLLDLLQAK